MGKAGKREYVQVLRLVETFDLEVLHGAVKDAMAHYLIDRFELELAFSDIYKRRKLTGKYAVKEEVAAEYRFLSFSCMLALVYGRLNPVGQIRLRGMLFDALKNDYGLGPLAYEIKVATHLMTLGFDVEFSDLEGNANYDFLAKNGGVCIEIECKFMSADVGKKSIARDCFSWVVYSNRSCGSFSEIPARGCWSG